MIILNEIQRLALAETIRESVKEALEDLPGRIGAEVAKALAQELPKHAEDTAARIENIVADQLALERNR